MVNVSRENRRYGRVIIEKALRVSMRSIGSEASYNMETRNVSDTGFFLRFEKPGRFPFTPSSIMEVWLTLEEGSTIFFNGKMTRVVHPDEAVSLDTEPGIAIKIIQIEKDEENILREFIRKKATERESSAKSAAGSQEESVAEVEAEAGQRKATRRKTASTKKKTSTRRKQTSSKKVSRKTATKAKPPAADARAEAEQEKIAEQIPPPPVQAVAPPSQLPPPPEDNTAPAQSTLPEDEEKAS